MTTQKGSVAREALEDRLEEEMWAIGLTPEMLKQILEAEMTHRWLLARREERRSLHPS